jgi:hypothetical protein
LIHKADTRQLTRDARFWANSRLIGAVIANGSFESTRS